MTAASSSRNYSDDEFSGYGSENASPTSAAPVHHKSNVGKASAKVKQQQPQTGGSAKVKAILKAAAAKVNREAELSESYYEEEEMAERAADALLLSVGKNKKRSKKLPNGTKTAVDNQTLTRRQKHNDKSKKKLHNLVTQRLDPLLAKSLPKHQRRILSRTLVKKTKCETISEKRTRQKERQNHVLSLAEPNHPRFRAEPKLRSRNTYASFDDVENCTFKPKIKENPNHEGDDGEDNNNQAKVAAFIRRMESSEQSRQSTVDRVRAEKQYLARLDKKECPKCGNVQSHSEVVDKRKKCPNCSVEYASKLAWGDIRDEFLDRIAKTNDEMQERKANLVAEYKPPFRMTVRTVYDADQKTIKRVEIPEKKWEEVKDDFIERMNKDQIQRLANQSKLKQKFEGEGGYCTFMPKISAATNQYNFEPFEDRMQADIQARELRRQEYELQYANKASKEASPEVEVDDDDEEVY